MRNPETIHSVKADSNNPEVLIKYIEQDPRYQEVVECVRQGKPLPPETRSWLKEIASVLIALPQDYYGKAYITEQIKEGAIITAGVNTAANVVDFVSNLPLYVFTFKSMGGFSSLILGLALDWLVLWSCNLSAAAAANRQKKNRRVAQVGTWAMIGLSFVKSIVSGVGVELLNNQSGLNQNMAAKLVQEQIEQVESLKHFLDDPQYKNALERCEKSKQELGKMNRQHPLWNSTYIRLYGSYGERNKNWNLVPTGQLPVCLRITRLESESLAAYKTAKAQLEAKLIRRTDMGNDLAFLKQEMPKVYQRIFIDKGDITTAEIASGVDAVAIASENFFGKLGRGDFASLGFALFFFSLSIITSAFAVMKTIRYAEREDVMMSRDEAISRERELWLESQWNELVERHQQELEALKQAQENQN